MSILERLFLKKHPADTKEVSYALTDLILDWMNENKIDIKKYEAEYLNPALDMYRKEAAYYFNENKEAATHLYFDVAGVLYMAQKGDNAVLKTLLQLLLKKENAYNIYRTQEALSRSDNWTKDKENPYVFHIFYMGNKMLKCYQAIYIQDYNYSSIDQIISELTQLRYHETTNKFEQLFGYVRSQSFKEKPYVMTELLYRQGYHYDKLSSDSRHPFRELIREALAESVADYNKQNELPLQVDILEGFADFQSYQYSEVWKAKDYKKNKFLKVKDLLECQEFLDKSKGKEREVLQNVLYCIGNKYVSDKERLYADFFQQLIGKHKFDPEWIIRLMSVRLIQTGNYVMSHVYIPLVKAIKNELTYSHPLIIVFEKKVFAFPLLFKEGMEVLRDIANRIESLEEKQLRLSILSPYFITFNFHPYGSGEQLVMEESDKTFPVIKSLVDDLNLLVPVALKGVTKNFYMPDEDNYFFTLNHHNTDLKIPASFTTAINRLLQQEDKGYQLIRIPLTVRKEKDRDNLYYYTCAGAYVSQKEFSYVIQNHVRKYFPEVLEALYKEVHFQNKDEVSFLQLKNAALERKESTEVTNAFLQDINWAWFKDKYIDKLKSKEQWYEVMHVILQCSGGKKPNAKWLKEAEATIEKFGHTQYVKELQVLLSESLKEEFWYFDTYRNALKGLIWTCTQVTPTDESLNIVRMVTEMAYTKTPGVGAKSSAIGNAALEALVESKKEEAFGMLTIMRGKTKYNSFITAIEKAIEKFKEHSEIPEEILADKSIPRFGMDETGKSIPVGDYVARFEVDGDKLSKSWTDKEGTEIKSINGKVDEKLIKEINEEYKQINQVFVDLKRRLRLYWLHNRTWTGILWKTNLLEHPLIYPHIENQLWINLTQGITFIIHTRKLYSVKGEPHEVNDSDEITFWHPVVASPNVIEEWQDYAWVNHLAQRERQIFREHYPFSEKEKAETQTMRFAHHFLEVKKLMAIANSAGWVFTYVHEGHSWPRVYIKPLDITAHLRCDYDRNDFAIPTKELYFTKGDSTKINDYRKENPERIALNEIPAATLSEIARDIDLFIATTSVANDPSLSEQRQELNNYRTEYTKGTFSENASASIRKRIIEKIAPIMKIRSKGMEGNYWIIQGKQQDYRINLGSGFAQIKESQKHINLLPDIKKVKSNKKIQLPIEDDETLYIIIAKAFYLQDDDQITDENIKALLF